MIRSKLSRRPFLALGSAAAVVSTSRLASADDATLNLSGLVPSFSTDFADPTKPIFRADGGPFSTRFEQFSGARTLVPNKELELYVDPHFVPSPDGTNSNGNNDSSDPHGKPAGLNPFRVEDGVLIITASKTPPNLLKTVDRPYVSGMISTDRSFDQRYGYFEIRAQLPAGQGVWPAFWLFGTTQKYPFEIDVVEALGHEKHRIYQSVHPNPARSKDGQVIPVRPGFDYSAGMHSYGVLWRPEKVTFYVDRKMTVSVDGAPFRDEVTVFMMANLAIGGNWGGDPAPDTHFPVEMRIEHIKAFKLA